MKTKCCQKLTHAMHRWALFQPLATNIAKFALNMRRLGPTVSNRILNQTGCDTWARRDNVRHAFLMYDEVAGWKVNSISWEKASCFYRSRDESEKLFFCFLFIMKNSFCESSKTSNKLSNCVLSSCVDAFPSKEKLNLLRVEYWMYDDVKRHAFFEKKREKNVMRIRRRCFQCYAALDHSEFRVSKYEELRICRDFWCLGSVEWHMNITYLLVFFDSCSCGSDDYDKHVSIFFGAF